MLKEFRRYAMINTAHEFDEFVSTRLRRLETQAKDTVRSSELFKLSLWIGARELADFLSVPS